MYLISKDDKPLCINYVSQYDYFLNISMTSFYLIEYNSVFMIDDKLLLKKL